MSPPLPVELNRDRRHEIRVAERYEADGPFSVDLRNHGDGVHVHVNVDGPLAEVARVAETNHYVDDSASAGVKVDVSPVDEAVTGTLRLATGYGSQETTVEVTVTPFDGTDEVPVGEDLATPNGQGEAANAGPVEEAAAEGTGGTSMQLVAVATGAVLLAVAVAVVVGGRVVVAGAGVVVVAALVAVLVSVW